MPPPQRGPDHEERHQQRGGMGQLLRRVLSGCLRTVDGHLSRTHVAVRLQRSTRELSEPPRRSLLDLAPDEVYPAGLITQASGGLLHHRFTLTPPLARRGGLLSVALALGLPRVGVTHRPALWSPDVPRHPHG